MEEEALEIELEATGVDISRTDREGCHERGGLKKPELEDSQGTEMRSYKTVPRTPSECFGKQQNERLQIEDEALVHVTGEETSTKRTFTGTCVQNKHSKLCLEDELETSQHQQQVFDLHDEVSSIFSDQDSDIKDVSKEREIVREALLQLKKEYPLGFSDTSWEFSDDDDPSEGDHISSDGYFSREDLQMTRLMAEEGSHENSLSKTLGERPESGARKLERETRPRCQTQHQDAMKREHQFGQENPRRTQALPSSFAEKDARKSERHPDGFSGTEKRFSGRNSPDNGYLSDIAILAKENEKLGEIIDHLQVNSCPQESGGFLELMDMHVPKEEYNRIENERFKLESILRENERLIREQEKTMEEERYEHEEECRILKGALRKAESEARAKANALHDCEAKIAEIKAKYVRQLNSFKSELEREREEKFKFEETVLVLQKCNADFEKDLEGMKHHIEQLEAQEEELEERHRRDIGYLEECLERESLEKNKLSQDGEVLLQELSQLKKEMFEETERHAVEKLQMNFNLEAERKKLVEIHSQMGMEDVRGRQSQAVKERILSESEPTPESTWRKGQEGNIERRIEEERQKSAKLEKDNRVMVMTMKGLLSGNCSTLRSLLSDGEMNEESLNDVRNIQRKLSEALKELEEVHLKNEEKDEELHRLTKKTERLRKEVVKMRELEDNNEELQLELERATRRLNELQRREKNTRGEIEEMTETIHTMNDNNSMYKDEIETLKAKIKDMEGHFAEEKSQVAKSLEHEKSAALQELMAKLEVEEEIRKGLENIIDNLKSDLHKTDERLIALEEEFLRERKELTAVHTEEMQKVKQKYELKQEELSETVDMVRKVTEEWEKMLRNTANRNEEERKRLEEEKRQDEVEHQRQMNEMQRQLQLCNCKVERGESHIENTVGESRNCHAQVTQPSHHEADKTHLSEGGNERVEQLMTDLQQKHKEEITDMENNFDIERRKLEESLNDANRRKMEELTEQSRIFIHKHEVELKKLGEKMSKDNQEAQRRLKEDVTKSLLNKSASLESKIEDLILQKVHEERHKTRQLAVQHKLEKEKCNTVVRNLKEKIHMYETEQRELRRAFEDEKRELGVAAQTLRKELCSLKEETNKGRKKDAPQGEEAFEHETQALKEVWEKRMEETMQNIKEDYETKMKSERRKYELHIKQLTTELALLKDKMKEEELQWQQILKQAKSESECSTKDRNVIEAKLEEEYERKLHKEKENISSSLESLRREIKLLQEHRKQLQIQLSNKGGYGGGAEQYMYPIKVNTPEVLVRLESELHQQMRNERYLQESRAREFEREIEGLREELSQQKAKSRREKAQLKARFESEKEDMAAEFEREKYGLRLVASEANTLKQMQVIWGFPYFPTPSWSTLKIKVQK